jgi:hypothetical protein
MESTAAECHHCSLTEIIKMQGNPFGYGYKFLNSTVNFYELTYETLCQQRWEASASVSLLAL